MQGKIYYTGDVCNQSGWFEITRYTMTAVDLSEIDGDRKILGIGRNQIGNVYHGHCGTRFVTEKAYNTYRSEAMKGYQEAINAALAAQAKA